MAMLLANNIDVAAPGFSSVDVFVLCVCIICVFMCKCKMCMDKRGGISSVPYPGVVVISHF